MPNVDYAFIVAHQVRDPRDQCGSQWRRLNTTLGVVLDDIN
ncbi:hypothetical protein BDE02_16G118000 [Populus trichocarpa]|nr:hypothetical protein BDE02_16G118000 [Populus trichocarpa]